ncbi:EAL domain-containing protein (putative c-di-GMP-specific phosphodiesterase class I) [Litoreibacter ponti]|uniref:EAL domain-containing protein (Putative c-di-GMP-specific phosphodiesterase class I) n=1 Tax=Litoreibacter ponti TaxID=1510457 RepID=A0A2T6BHU3_9RHOB|nr:EAL domain-containing protein [Litoreibacter ponti]PTX55630.1 EAL domain-containing protein (putative c-di-GMP-specific phosphodiesterase class I) [Litoreibacter ponti]
MRQGSADFGRLIIGAGSAGMTGDIIDTALAFVRGHLEMEVAYLSEFVGEKLVFRAVCAPGLEDMIAVGGEMPLDQVYCPHILEGRLPELIPDTAAIPFAQTIPLTTALPIGSHVSVPICRSDGSFYGMFCCLSRKPQASLNERDLSVMRAFAGLSADHINMVLAVRTDEEARRARIRNVLEEDNFEIVYQPIFDMGSRRPNGFEALSRFKSDPYRPPNLWFDEARSVGLQEELECATISRALAALPELPRHVYVSVNASPNTVMTGALSDLFRTAQADRIVLEITEHAEVEDYDKLMDQLDQLRFRGARLAIDDAGAGYSGLQQIVRMKPDILKLDISLTSGIGFDVVKRSLAAALVSFANEIGAQIVAEGIETEDEFAALHDLGVPLGQGYLLGRPADLLSAKSRFQLQEVRRA